MAMGILCLCGLLGAPAPVAAPPVQLLPNPGFEAGLSGWRFAPGDSSQAAITATTEEPRREHVLDLHPDGRTLGVETERLKLGRDLAPDQAYEVTAMVLSLGVQSGSFAFSMYAYDAQGKALKQIVFASLSPNSKPHDWRRRRGVVGPGSANPLPDGTDTVAIRFSFWEAKGDCRGQVLLDDVSLRPTPPSPFAAWPPEILATVGELQIRFESRSFWTLYRIDYRGVRLGRDAFGSHYGTVVDVPGVGFVGSGHIENEDEELLDLALTVDGQPVTAPPAREYACREITLSKVSRVRDLGFRTRIRVGDGSILEEVTMRAARPFPAGLIYLFMHPWEPSFTDYLGETLAGDRVEGTFTGDKSQRIDRPVRWSAVYDRSLGKGAVTCMLEAAAPETCRTRYWDMPETYRKHYFVTFIGATVPAGQDLRYRCLTVPFTAPPEIWQQRAAETAASGLAR